ncbi:MAG: RsmD family RNA methyltransferase, partial [Bacilli bacterium]|nr:RsmD family RNA methyltransferase [Bacilli bacterium]
SYDSFFQVNNLTAGYIFDIISSNINENDEVLDLYSGVGTLSICAAKKAKKVLGVEVVKNAVLNALINKNINKCLNTEFILGDVPKVVSKINDNFNTFIFDPPRKGLDNFTINYALNKKPNKIIYVSCNPITLVRDLKLLKDSYDVKEVNLIDMFSFTHHYETVCILIKKDV